MIRERTLTVLFVNKKLSIEYTMFEWKSLRRYAVAIVEMNEIIQCLIWLMKLAIRTNSMMQIEDITSRREYNNVHYSRVNIC